MLYASFFSEMVPETAASFILSDFEPYTDVCAKYCKESLSRIKGKTKTLALKLKLKERIIFGTASVVLLCRAGF